MSEYPKNPGPLPAERLCNKYNNHNPIPGEGALGNETKGKMYYEGKGDKKSLVETLQTMLRDLKKYDLGSSGPKNDGVDGTFGNSTEDAVKQFQEEHKDWDGNALKVDGLVGPETADALNREMVDIWYDKYETPTELTQSFFLATANQDALEKGISIVSEGIECAKVVLVGLDEYIITLCDSSKNRFYFEGERKFRVIDKKEKQLSEGRMICEEDIVLKSSKSPHKVELGVGEDILTFFV